MSIRYIRLIRKSGLVIFRISGTNQDITELTTCCTIDRIVHDGDNVDIHTVA
ncbi:hypothetical protein [Paenibacillus donghaensis]|uniref:hypothetical protein n=1 Tax=Paenibacillus donghaensis TaxID=414771 RepID=UPI0012FDF03C|nr:hypothetical protein [Paenibacillus donghaensis]